MTAVDVAQALWLLVAAIGLSLSVSYAGLPVLGAGAFVAVGGYGTALLGPGGQGWPLGVAVLVSVVGAAVTGWLVAVGASRLEGPSLALATWALAWLVQRALLAYPDQSGGVDGLTTPAPAHLVSPSMGVRVTLTPAVHVGIALVIGVGLLGALARLGRGPGGLDLAALRDGPALAASLGVPVAARRRTVLAVTAALCALSGAGSTVLLGLVSPSDVSPLVSLELFVAVLLGGTARWWGPVVGVAVLTALPHVGSALASAGGFDVERSRGVVTALLLVAVLAARGPLTRHRSGSGAAPGQPAAVPAPGSAPAELLLQARDLTVRYDGVTALDGAGITLYGGHVHALVGPNGSGKSTMLRVLAGELEPGSADGASRANGVGGAGVVELAGVPHRARGPRERVLAGVARTPQHTAALPGVTADRQVAIGVRGGAPRRGSVLRHLLATPSSRTGAEQAAVERALVDTGLTHLRGADPTRLATGDQRLLQVARAVATGARVLLLDEPAAGMTTFERARLAAALRRLAGNGLAILLVEHDMRLVGSVADWVTVLDVGRVLASGPVEQVRADPAVQQAYLGVASEVSA